LPKGGESEDDKTRPLPTRRVKKSGHRGGTDKLRRPQSYCPGRGRTKAESCRVNRPTGRKAALLRLRSGNDKIRKEQLSAIKPYITGGLAEKNTLNRWKRHWRRGKIMQTRGFLLSSKGPVERQCLHTLHPLSLLWDSTIMEKEGRRALIKGLIDIFKGGRNGEGDWGGMRRLRGTRSTGEYRYPGAARRGGKGTTGAVRRAYCQRK